MQTDTALGAKLKRAGFLPREVRLQVAIAEFINNGGSIERAHELIAVAADKLGSEGLVDSASNGFLSRANAPRTNLAKGFTPSAAKAVSEVPDARPERNGGGLCANAEKAPAALPASVSPYVVSVKQHSRAKRGAAAIASVQRTMAKTLFDTYQLPGDDRGIGDVTWKELQGLARKHAEAYRLTSLISGYAEANPEARVRDVLKEDTLKEFIDIARLSNVH